MGKKTIKSVENEMLVFIEENSRLQKEMNRIKGLFDLYSYSTTDELIMAVGRLREEIKRNKDYIRENEGRLDETNENLRKENYRLWYLVRVSLKDPSIFDEVIKPGDNNNQDGLRYFDPGAPGQRKRNPFSNN